MSAAKPAVRGNITKSKAGHYCLVVRSPGGRMSIHDKLPTLQAARELLALLKQELSEVSLPARTTE